MLTKGYSFALSKYIFYIYRVTAPVYGESHRQFYLQSESPLFQALGRLVHPGYTLMEGLTEALSGK